MIICHRNVSIMLLQYPFGKVEPEACTLCLFCCRITYTVKFIEYLFLLLISDTFTFISYL